MVLIPCIVEQDGRSGHAYDVCSRLLKDNILFIGSENNGAVASQVNARLPHLEAESMNKKISLDIHGVTSELTINDAVQFIQPEKAKDSGIIDAVLSTRNRSYF